MVPMGAVYVVDGKRTPHAKAGLDLKDVPAPWLGAPLVRRLLDRAGIGDDQVDEVVFGNVGNPVGAPNVARVIALAAGLDKGTSAHTVHRNCASGLEAVFQGFLLIASGRADVVVAGGVESMSGMPLLYSEEMTELFARLFRAKTLPGRIRALSGFRPWFLRPVVAIERGLTDPFCGLNMGLTAEKLARELGIGREEQDEVANDSHRKAVAAQREGAFDEEILPVVAGRGADAVLSQDVGPRANSTLASLAKLRPWFDRKSGTVTVGNSCPVTDGGSAVLLAGEGALRRHGLSPMARLVDVHFCGLEPERMGMGPLPAAAGVLARAGMGLEEMDLVEINEAFAAQVVAVRRAFADEGLASRWGVDRRLGEIPDERLNVHGGAIALGHPVGSTGCRLVVTLAHALARRGGAHGLAALCVGGGQGGAVVLENLRR